MTPTNHTILPDLPVAIPAVEMQSTKIGDRNHEGTILTRLADGWLFSFLMDGTCATADRIVLVALAQPETHYSGGIETRETTYEDHVPDGAYLALDLDGPGYAVLGVDVDAEIPAKLGTVLWDSAAEPG